MRAETVLLKDSCCCGATKAEPCACMIQGVMECDEDCPCSLAKLSFNNEGEQPIGEDKELGEPINWTPYDERNSPHDRKRAETFDADTCNECGVSISSWACGAGEGHCPMHSTCQKPFCVERRANLGIASDGKAYPKRDLSNMSMYGRGSDTDSKSIYGRGNAPNKDAEYFGAESPSATIPSWITPVATVAGFVLGFMGIKYIKGL